MTQLHSHAGLPGGGGNNINTSSQAKESSPIFNLATQIVLEEWAFFDLLGAHRVRQLQPLPPWFKILIPGFVAQWQKGRMMKGEQAHSSSHL